MRADGPESQSKNTCESELVSIVSVALIISDSFRSDDPDEREATGKHLSEFAK